MSLMTYDQKCVRNQVFKNRNNNKTGDVFGHKMLYTHFHNVKSLLIQI